MEHLELLIAHHLTPISTPISLSHQYEMLVRISTFVHNLLSASLIQRLDVGRVNYSKDST